MPSVSVWMIRLSLVYLLMGITLGVLLLINKAILISPELMLLLPVHIELLIFGWIIQFTLGTAYWILPRYLISKDRGSSALALLMPVFLNTGIWMVLVSNAGEQMNFLALYGRIAELLAVLFFVILHWNRVGALKKAA
tara:strand:+ start:42837 stop:43250 length:414 start_codon:yes stop_codon:yes gene_type:complete